MGKDDVVAGKTTGYYYDNDGQVRAETDEEGLAGRW